MCRPPAPPDDGEWRQRFAAGTGYIILSSGGRDAWDTRAAHEVSGSGVRRYRAGAGSARRRNTSSCFRSWDIPSFPENAIRSTQRAARLATPVRPGPVVSEPLRSPHPARCSRVSIDVCAVVTTGATSQSLTAFAACSAPRRAPRRAAQPEAPRSRDVGGVLNHRSRLTASLWSHSPAAATCTRTPRMHEVSNKGLAIQLALAPT